ncbi:8-oxo-dGTP diphosphatase [Aerococcaceae bacterium NML130460]|nr:8-oxo-dGTP diphosphatase [Aerococcaceae bacterium NML171108]MCW6680321.1 8-oxo-dGTP diphosphatase [Aerococcaceae bacterium NML130460]
MVKLATICYVDNGSQFLLLHRNKKLNDVHQGKWIGVGGKIEAGETPEECAIREIYEETGLMATQLNLHGIITFPEFTPDNDWYTYVFRATDFEGELRLDCPEGTLEWVDYDKILDKPTWDGDLIFIRWLLENRPFFSAKFCYDADGNFMEYRVRFYE